MNERSRYASLILTVCATVAWTASVAGPSKATSIELPAETTHLGPGPSSASARVCIVCHSADYIYVQPPLTREQWRREVSKMKNVFGAPIRDADIDEIVTYLMTQNGEP